MAELVIVVIGDALEVVDPDYGAVMGRLSGIVEAEGRILDPQHWTLAGEARELAAGR